MRSFRASVVAANLFINVLGAGLTFFYFTFIESGLWLHQTKPDARTETLFFLSVMILALVTLLVFSGTYYKPLWEDLSKDKDELELLQARALAGTLLNIPFTFAILSLSGWLSAGLLYGLIPRVWTGVEWGTWHRSFHVVFGIVFVGAPFTVLLTYFVLEWIVRCRIQSLVSAKTLGAIPKSIRVNVSSKVIVASLMIGTLPVTIISYIVLNQIHQIQATFQDIGSFLRQMPFVIAFFLTLAVLLAVSLSIFVGRSLSEPLGQIRAAMERIRQGDLELNVPVVSNDEIGFMAQGFNQMVAGLRELNFIKDTFGSYLSPEVVSEILNSPSGLHLGGELREVTILVSDLRAFTSLVASLPPEVIVKILNLFLEKMVEIIFKYGGTIDEFTGDGILAFFGAPRLMTDDTTRAVQCAIDMQRAMPELNRELKANLVVVGLKMEQHSHEGQNKLAEYPPSLAMGIGISKGPVILGNIGCDRRKKYGAVGTPINLAFRIEDEADAGEILVTEEVYSSVHDIFRADFKPGVKLKGIHRPLMLYSVVV
jgi:sigma-B regulation protein RsbU (phosphoserine phosphatase)